MLISEKEIPMVRVSLETISVARKDPKRAIERIVITLQKAGYSKASARRMAEVIVSEILKRK